MALFRERSSVGRGGQVLYVFCQAQLYWAAQLYRASFLQTSIWKILNPRILGGGPAD
jgi:hypothetical protein